MDNLKTLETLGIQDTGNIGHTRHRQHWAYKTQNEDKQKHNTENLKDEEHGFQQNDLGELIYLSINLRGRIISQYFLILSVFCMGLVLSQ